MDEVENPASLVFPAAPRISREQWWIGLWIAGGAASLVPGLLALLASRRLRRSAPSGEVLHLWTEVAGERAAKIPIRISRDLATPGIASAIRPEILLPEAALEWERDRLLAVLRHEFHHIAMARRSQVGRRIRALLSPRSDISPRRAGLERLLTAAMAAVGFLIVLVGFSSPETARAADAVAIDDSGFRGPILDRNGILLATSNPARMPEAMREKAPVRWYPEGETFAHLTGFVLPDDKGGITVGKPMLLEDSPALADGKPRKLTVDARIQRLAAQALAARQLPGAVLVMDPDTGDILAMASWPSFDPNRFAGDTTTAERLKRLKAPEKPLLNRASLSIAPGSFAKLLTALAAAKADKADRVMHCGPNVSLGTARFRDWNSERNEQLDLRSALATSCNTYFIPLAWEMGGEMLASIGTDLNLGPGAGSPWSWRATWGTAEPGMDLTRADLAMTAIGQGRTTLSIASAVVRTKVA